MPVTPPTLPLVGPSPLPPDALGGTTVTCTALDNLQTKMNAVTMGDTLVAEANHTFSGNFLWPRLVPSGLKWTAFRSSMEASLPAAGTRVNPPTDRVFMPKVQNPVHDYALRTGGDSAIGPASEGMRLVGIEFSNDPAYNDFVNPQYNVLGLNYFGGLVVPPFPFKKCTVERCYVHGNGWTSTGLYNGSNRRHQFRGITNHGDDVRIVDSWIDGFQAAEDTQGIWCMTGTGYLIENNYLCASGQGIMFGGSYPTYTGPGYPNGDIAHPQDITIRRNLFEKLDKWKPESPDYDSVFGPTVKPTLELKMGHRILFEGNHLHNSFLWPAFTFDAIDGADLQTTGLRRQTIEDITVRYNLVTQSVSFLQIYPAVNPIARIAVHDNLVFNYYRPLLGTGPQTNGIALNFYAGETLFDVRIEHNTILCERGGVLTTGESTTLNQHWRFANNIWNYGRGTWGMSGHGYPSPTAANIALAALDLDLKAEALVRGPVGAIPFTDGTPPFVWEVPSYTSSVWSPPSNTAFLTPGIPSVAGVDYVTGRLLAGSPLKSAATDGKDVGVDFTLYDAAQAGTLQQNLNPTAGGIMSPAYF